MTEQNDDQRTAEERFKAGQDRASAWYAKRLRPNPVTNRLGEPFAGPIPATKENAQ